MSDFYYKIDGHTLHLTSSEGIPAKQAEGGDWPWAGNTDITKVIIDDPIQLPPDSSELFGALYKLTEIEGLENLDTSQVTNMSNMFAYSDLTSLDLSGFDTSHVTDMSSMFAFCYHLQSLTLSSFDTSSVTNMSDMFHSCYSALTSLDLSSFDTSHVTDMSSMFRSCSSLKSLDLSGWAVSNVWNMSHMFEDCPSLQSVTATDLRIISMVRIAALDQCSAATKTLQIAINNLRETFGSSPR